MTVATIVGSNCAVNGAIRNVNAIELTWTLPASYNVPDIDTKAEIVCATTLDTAIFWTMY
jgi:hypothetical protein